MSNVKLAIGFADYDHTRALRDGRVEIEGVDASFETAVVVTEIFQRVIEGELDVAELGLTYFLRTFELDNSALVALPVFPNRQFRHSGIYVNASSGIQTPRDLIGKTVGEFAVYGHDAGVWPKGILSDEYGVTPEQCRWVIGGLDWPLSPVDFIPKPQPTNVDVTQAPEGTDLGQMLEEGEIDALISADVPKCVLEDSPRVARLFPDYKAMEHEYYRRTGIFPAMHTVVMRKELVAQHPGLAHAVYQGFCDAKDIEAKRERMARIFNHMLVMEPWSSHLYDENRHLLGDDSWPYGLAANRHMVDTFLRYHFEQGLSKRRLTCEDIFVPELLGT